MRGCFYARTSFDEVWLVVAGAEVAPPDGALLVAPAEAAFRVPSWLGRGTAARAMNRSVAPPRQKSRICRLGLGGVCQNRRSPHMSRPEQKQDDG